LAAIITTLDTEKEKKQTMNEINREGKKERKGGEGEKGGTKKMFCRDSGVDEKKYCNYYKCDLLHKDICILPT
jgi:hypothetical protein